ncbi:hypothetical protein CVT25_002353 [Psilocybe cyanescens]|uniref:Uncharacterized protein n=1 Tax=Psilocybe cyanescens TaxID=93625 RepID=A0A409WKH1_PSICY|nr:hypothetical protein CVT25_002353 [Psilocybe cyanescens]
MPPLNSRSRPNSPNPSRGLVSPPSGPAGFQVAPHHPNRNPEDRDTMALPFPMVRPSEDRPAEPCFPILIVSPSPDGATFQVKKRTKSSNPYGQPISAMYAPAPSIPIGRCSSHVPGGQPYYNPTIGRSISRGPSPTPPGMVPRPPSHISEGQGYYGIPTAYGAPIGGGSSHNLCNIPPAAGQKESKIDDLLPPNPSRLHTRMR